MRKNLIKIVYSTNFNDQEISDFNKHISKTIGCLHEIYPYKNFNQFSLTEIYNKAIKDHNEENSIMVFMHHDIFFRTNGWGKLLLNKFNYEDYQIIGVAGSTSLPKSGMWWEDKSKMVGIVEHTDGIKTWISEYTKPFNGIKPTVIVDGLFMAVDCNDIESNFNEDFKGFHLYDVSFSFENYLAGCNVGVITSIRILHMSMGQTNEQWEENRKQFAELYKDELPEIIKKDIIIEKKRYSLTREPYISVIIPTKNNYDLLKKNLDSWKKFNTYKNIEIIVADTGSDKSTLEKYEKLDNCRIIYYDYYNFAKINNDVVRNYVDNKSELMLFCNDDVELLNDVLNGCVYNYLNNKNVGTIGIRLHYGDNTVQHNGIAMWEKNNSLELSHIDIRSNEYDIKTNINSKGNTGAFLMINKNLFVKQGMFNENYLECFEDVELNLGLSFNGYKNITVSESVAYHYESVSRNKYGDSNKTMSNDFIKIKEYYRNNKNEN